MSTEPAAPAAPPEVLTLDEAAAYLRITPKAARRMVADGRLPHFRTGTGPRARIRVYLWALRRAALDNFPAINSPGSAQTTQAEIRALFAERRRRR